MSGIYYVEAADWLRSVGLTVVEVKGWQTRARSSGGFSAPPLGVQWHHTASQTTPTNDTNWQYLYSDVRPIGNMTIMRNGDVWIGAAGGANTAGKGGPLTMSRGTIPLDGANSRTWAIEVANNGVGEPWPRVQIDAYFAASNELNRRFGNKPTDVFTHYAWTPGRKIDPAKASAVLGPWQPRACTSSGTWEVADVRAECARRAIKVTPPPTTPPPTTPPVYGPPPTTTSGAVEMILVMKYGGTPTSSWSGYFSLDGGTSRLAISSATGGMDHVARLVRAGAVDAKTGAKVTSTSWADVSHTTSSSELNKYLGAAK